MIVSTDVVWGEGGHRFAVQIRRRRSSLSSCPLCPIDLDRFSPIDLDDQLDPPYSSSSRTVSSALSFVRSTLRALRQHRVPKMSRHLSSALFIVHFSDERSPKRVSRSTRTRSVVVFKYRKRVKINNSSWKQTPRRETSDSSYATAVLRFTFPRISDRF